MYLLSLFFVVLLYALLVCSLEVYILLGFDYRVSTKPKGRIFVLSVGGGLSAAVGVVFL